MKVYAGVASLILIPSTLRPLHRQESPPSFIEMEVQRAPVHLGACEDSKIEPRYVLFLLKRLPVLYIHNKISLHSLFFMRAGNVEFNLHVYNFLFTLHIRVHAGTEL